MNLELLEYIKSLSLKDKKTLSQKALKVSEESGELAKVILPFDNAHGTTHRFIEKGRILEEVTDVWTCPDCKTHHDRDVNAAINILNKGVKKLKEARHVFFAHGDIEFVGTEAWEPLHATT